MTERQPDADDLAPPMVPNGYRLIIPPGWVRIPLRHGTERALEDLVFFRLRELPPGVSKDDGMAYRLSVRRSVTEQIAAARTAGGLDLYLPLTTRYGTPIAASFLVGEHVTGESGPIPFDRLLVRPAPPGARENSTTHEPAGTPAVRREYVRPAESERDVRVATRRVEYALPVPHDPGRIVSVVFSTPGDGDIDSAFTAALIELFDASVMTFRWTRDGVDLIPEPLGGVRAGAQATGQEAI